ERGKHSRINVAVGWRASYAAGGGGGGFGGLGGGGLGGLGGSMSNPFNSFDHLVGADGGRGSLYYGGRGQSDFTIARSAQSKGVNGRCGIPQAPPIAWALESCRRFGRPHRRRFLRMRMCCKRPCRSQPSKQADEIASPHVWMAPAPGKRK